MTKEQKKHYDRTSRLGCVLCIYKGVLDTPAELHHIRKGGKRDNAPVIPLCPEHHRGATGVHGMGSRGFTKYHGISEDLLLDCTTHLLENIMGKEDEGVIIHRSITDKDFVYINDVSTDVLRTFKKMGWIPPSEQKRIKAEEDAALDQFQEEKDNG